MSTIDSKDTGGASPQSSPDNPFEDAARAAPRAGADGLRNALDYLRALENVGTPAAPKASILEMLYMDSIKAIEARLPLLAEMPLPIPSKPRQIIRDMQDVLEALAALLLTPPETENDEGVPAPARSVSSQALWRALRLLSRHLLISSLTAAPPGAGIWRQLHRVYAQAGRQDVTQSHPENAAGTLQDEYYAAILLGCAQPTSFTGREVLFLDTYLERFSERVDTGGDVPAGSPVTFWIDPESDAPATPYSRRPPAPETPVYSFSCGRLASLLESQLAALETGTPARQIDLPSFASTDAGLGVLTRLIHLWGNPGKRRFPRRKQNYRGKLCLGFDNLCQLYGTTPQPAETSNWMITNESPDGYAVMHLSGKTQAITAGDVAALRTESGSDWQLCIIRWALSENQEHIELGLQILSPRAYTADIALPGASEASTRRPALVLPATPSIRPNEGLVVRSGALAGHPNSFVLVIERDNIEVREIDDIQCDERNGLIELYGIKPR
ncbi:MAG: hypothetical protein LBI87_04465 [Candidatus Accumulibacter sp.]|jgi:hypothetical protein|nr:hypothetical protein [Accumulibacter sp.]